jgi:type I restriction enzyme S subunit
MLRMNNIVNGNIDYKKLKYKRNEAENLILKEGDLLFNRTNSLELVGKCAVFHSKDKYTFASYLIRVRLKTDIANPDYIAIIINSKVGRRQIEAMRRKIIGQANINSNELKKIMIPLPPLNVQESIVEMVHDGRRQTEGLKAEIEGIIEKANKYTEDAIVSARYK